MGEMMMEFGGIAIVVVLVAVAIWFGRYVAIASRGSWRVPDPPDPPDPLDTYPFGDSPACMMCNFSTRHPSAMREHLTDGTCERRVAERERKLADKVKTRIDRMKVQMVLVAELFPGEDPSMVFSICKSTAKKMGLDLDEYLGMVMRGKEQDHVNQ